MMEDTQRPSLIITSDLRKTINTYVGRDLIPPCAIGKTIFFQDGNIIFETFDEGDVSGARVLTKEGEIVNIIQEKTSNNLHIITNPN